MNAQELYNQFKAGYRWMTARGLPWSYQCNTCAPNYPPGFTWSRPAGTSNYTYTGYGISTISLDEAWNKYIAENGGPTTDQQAAALQQKMREEAAAQAAYDANQAQLAAQASAAEQLRLKSAMLQSDTAIFSTPETYKALLNDTNDQIRQYNANIAATNNPNNPALQDYTRLVDAGAAPGVGGDYTTTAIDEATNDQPKESSGRSMWLLLLPIALLVFVILYIAKAGKS